MKRWLPGIGQRRDEENRDFREVKLFCMIVYWWIHDIMHLSKPIVGTTPRLNTNDRNGLWGNKCTIEGSKFHQIFIEGNKCTTLA